MLFTWTNKYIVHEHLYYLHQLKQRHRDTEWYLHLNDYIQNSQCDGRVFVLYPYDSYKENRNIKYCFRESDTASFIKYILIACLSNSETVPGIKLLELYHMLDLYSSFECEILFKFLYMYTVFNVSIARIWITCIETMPVYFGLRY